MPEQSFLTDIKTIRERARRHIDGLRGFLTSSAHPGVGHRGDQSPRLAARLCYHGEQVSRFCGVGQSYT